MGKFFTFFDHPFFSVMGGLFTLLSVFGLFCTLFYVIRGFVPVWYRIGKGLSQRKIAIFATDKYEDLKSVILDSGLFKEKNIVKIDKDCLKKAESYSFYVVHYSSVDSAAFDEIIQLKKDNTAMIVYAPTCDGKINDSDMNKIDSQRNAVVTNFRGRLLNDIVVSMISTSHQIR
ncbi:hypothetical protein [Salinivibrio sp. SS2]|uniref:hypothetical protein n=1 Tax=Salinivibrio sp. SS2 TaxID=1892894 RepID=UPI00084BC4A4|nr:hypothetical protein [Salinivibrio sp. DV]ODQ01433.1 hypothetical protein BGK46_16720 [Salinivibrio sp. DV]